ncbi:DNA primase [Atopobacter phocae]|uniref:DNA primase n=1 Tax=Atopobacter phocae TaxID=136492 RepID=UPI0004728384|nr:DNA primase [Atopobacter phocae]
MVRLSPEIIKDVSENVDILPIIEHYVELKKRGKNYFGYCPFHEERTPSFSVAPEKQLYHCFSCGRGGNVFGFIQEIDQVSFPEAVKKVAELGNLDIDLKIDNQSSRKITQYESTYSLLNKATRFFHHTLKNTIAGEEAKKYIKNRGLTDEIIETFQLGFAPINRTLLHEIFESNELTEESIQQSGLFTEGNNEPSNTLISRFYNRLIIPLRNEDGKPVGLSGRTVSDTDELDASFQQAKYINSPETALFHKSQFLFNFDLAKKAIRRENEVLLLEGYMDVISVYQAGISQAVASMGTSLTQEQILKLRPLTNHIIISYDGDSAGLKATDRAIQMIRSTKHFDISILNFSDGMDPDDYIQKNGAEAFRNHYLHKRDTPFEFYKRFYALDYQLSNPNEVSKYIEKLLPELQFESRLVQTRYIKELSLEFSLDEQILIEMFEGLPTKEKSLKPTIKKSEPITELPELSNRLQRAQKQLIYRLLTNDETWHLIDFNELSFPDENFQLLFWILEVFHQQYEAPFHIQDVLLELSGKPHLEKLLVDISYLNLNEELSPQEIKDLVDIITVNKSYEEQIKQLNQEIKTLYAKGENHLATELGQQLIELIRNYQMK